MERPIIGAFLMEDLDDDRDEQHYQLSHLKSFVVPSLLRTVTSRDDDDNNNSNHRRILLRGPPSVTTSVLFEFAISIASLSSSDESTTSCRYCCRNRQDGRNICLRNDCCEQCITVTVIRSKTLGRDDSFPIPCRPQDDNELPSSLTNRRTYDDSDPQHYSQYHQKVLRRIQIVYVSSIQETLQYLLTIASQPISHRPLGGIFIEQLDDIVMPQHNQLQQQQHKDDIATYAIQMSQTVAILMDTVSFMEKTYHCSPTVVVSLHGDDDTTNSSTVPSNHRFYWNSSFWAPLHLTLVPVAIRHGHGKDIDRNDDDKTILGQYHLTVKRRHDAQVIAALTVSENHEKETCIVWSSKLDGN